MLVTIAVLLLALWFIGVVGFQVVNGFIHVLLVLAIIMFLIRIIEGKNPVVS